MKEETAVLWFTREKHREGRSEKSEGNFFGIDEHGYPIKGQWYSHCPQHCVVLCGVEIYDPKNDMGWNSDYDWVSVPNGPKEWASFQVGALGYAPIDHRNWMQKL